MPPKGRPPTVCCSYVTDKIVFPPQVVAAEGIDTSFMPDII